MAQAFQVKINGKVYNLANQHETSYKVTEVPSHYDTDPKMERRVIFNNFSRGILKTRDEPSTDVTYTSAYTRQTYSPEGMWWANGCDTRMGDRIMAQRATNTNVTVASQFIRCGDGANYSWAICKNHVYAVTGAGGNTWTLSKDFSAIGTITSAAWFQNTLIVSVQTNATTPLQYWYWDQTSTTTNWTQGSTNFKANYFAVIRNQLWRASNLGDFGGTQTAAIFSNTNALSSVGWTTANVVGDPTSPITALDVYDDFLLIFKADGLYSIDRGGNVYPVFPGFRMLGINLRPLGQWRDNYYIAADNGMVWEWSKRDVNRIGFDHSEPYPMAGSIFAIPNAGGTNVAGPNFMLQGFTQNQGTTQGAYILCWDGTPKKTGASGSWNPFLYFTTASHLLQVDGLGLTNGNISTNSPVLQVGISDTTAATHTVYQMTNPFLDAYLVGNFDTSTQSLYLPGDNGALEDEDKVLEKITVRADNASTGTIGYAYAMDEDILTLTFTDVGPSVDADRLVQIFYPTRPFPKYKTIVGKLSITANASAASPIVREVVYHYKQRDPQRRVWTLVLLGEENITAPTGRVDTRKAKVIIGDLNDARRTRQQIQFQDINGQTWTVYVDEVGEQVAILRRQNAPTYLINVTLVEAAEE